MEHAIAPARLRLLWSRHADILVPVGVAAAAKLAMALLAYVLLDQDPNLLRRMAIVWDGEHYLAIARTGYQHRFEGPGDSPHFAFLYPMVVRLLGSTEAVALLVNNLASLAAVGVVAWHLGRRPALFLALFPSWLVYGSVAYSEGLYVLLAAIALALWERSLGWGQAWGGLAAGAAAMARFMGGPALVAAAIPWGRWRSMPRWAGLALLGLCGAATWGWLWWATGDFLGYFAAQKAWGGEITWPWLHFDWLLHGWFTNQSGTLATGNLGPFDFAIRDLLFLVPSVWGLALLCRRPGGAPLVAYSLVILLTGVCTAGTPAAALPRYLVAGFPAIAILGTRLTSRGAWAAYATAAIVVATHGLGHHLYGYWS
ncbi:MAG TPA: hypothetical protein VHI93_07410 [Candidatus Thermoplasmatota archaeon]|nr:hypothetical protein [Candidatus Thermoplasmatota archaeon]